jgi:PD-(D/E)XK nuclease superfamily protein
MQATHQRGAVAEAAIALAAIKIGIGVFSPRYDGERYDLILDLRPRLVRVQCKAATLYGDVIVVRCRSGRRTRAGILMRAYTCAEIDAFAAYCAEIDRCFFLPIEKFEGRNAITLRVGPTRNNQRLGVNWAEDYSLEKLALHCADPGAVAQLGERCAGSA